MMKLLLACVTVAVLAQEVELVRYRRRRESMKDILISLNLTSTGYQSQNTLDVYYGDNLITPGYTLDYQDTAYQPSIEYDQCEPGRYYTLCIIDIDFPYTGQSSGRPYLLSLIVNINDVQNCYESGVVLAPYNAPLLMPGTGNKRIVIALFVQTCEIDSASCIENSYDCNRSNFDMAEYASINDLCQLDAATYYEVGLPDAY